MNNLDNFNLHASRMAMRTSAPWVPCHTRENTQLVCWRGGDEVCRCVFPLVLPNIASLHIRTYVSSTVIILRIPVSIAGCFHLWLPDFLSKLRWCLSSVDPRTEYVDTSVNRVGTFSQSIAVSCTRL